ncbi:MAG: hypothetical protein JOZ75_05660 [Candidatus Dormibacteraeota bacterium]|nr:hypothetical protein [Candidatus Dormibacteraeota bacterium]
MMRRSARAQRGQVLSIFAIMSLVLFALVGLALDAGISYFSSAGLDRGAAASALAGVPYMPDGWSSGTANNEVQAIAVKNGFTNGSAGVTVTACQVDSGHSTLAPCGTSANPAADNLLAAKICEPVQSTFLRLIGIGTHTECRTAIAEYLRPILMGSPGGQSGGDLNNDSTALGGATNKYFIRTEGYGTQRSEGDAYTPVLTDSPSSEGTCSGSGHPYAADGSSNCWAQFNGYTPDDHAISTVLGTDQGGSSPGAWPISSSLPNTGGYNYLVYIPAGQQGTVEVFNPIFAPDSHGGGPGTDPCLGAKQSPAAPNHNYNFHECDSMPAFVDGNGNDSAAANKVYYSTMSYTLLTVPNLFDHRSDAPISQMLVKPIDAVNWNASPPKWSEVSNNSTHSGGLPALFQQWQPVCGFPTTSSPASTETSTLVQQAAGSGNGGSCALPSATSAYGTYFRLRIDTLAWDGGDPQNGGNTQSKAHKGLAVGVVGANGSLCTGCSIGAIDDMAIYTPLVASQLNTPVNMDVSLMSVPPEYAGQTIEVDIYDPGDVSCTNGSSPQGSPNCSNLMSIVDNNGNVATLASSTRWTGGSPTPGAVWTGPSKSLLENRITSGDCDQGSLPGNPATVQALCSATHDVPNNPDQRTWNGTWVRWYIVVPANYNPGNNPNNWYWSLRYGLTNATGTDTVTLSAGYPGAPVHLVVG